MLIRGCKGCKSEILFPKSLVPLVDSGHVLGVHNKYFSVLPGSVTAGFILVKKTDCY